jgi:hypothetical protein
MSSVWRHVAALFRACFVTWHTGEQLRERCAIDVHRRRTRASGGQLEHSVVQPFVEKTKAYPARGPRS